MMGIGNRCGRLFARGVALGAGGLIVATLAPCRVSAAPQQKLLYSFCATGVGFYCTDGNDPRADLIRDASGNLIGTTEEGGADGAGTVFELSPNKAKTAWTHKVLYRFCAQGGGNCTDGSFPEAGVIADASGRLFGTTTDGGAAGDGTVFMLSPPARGKTLRTEKVLYSFCQQPGCSDGAFPEAAVIEDGSGNLYGTTVDGGASGEGVVFELMPPSAGQTAWKEVVLYSFCAQTNCTDGRAPRARLIRDALTGTLFGTTEEGGADSEGTAFSLTPPTTGQTAWTQTVLYSFCAQTGCTDGEFPEARLTRDQSGTLYGTTSEGGFFDEGTVFELAPPAVGHTDWTETVLHSFCARGGTDCTDGSFPEAGLVRDPSGNLYGTANEGGAGGAGALFELMPPAAGNTAWKEIVLHSFCAQRIRECAENIDAAGAIPTDGAFPAAGVIRDAAGNLYGTTSAGGAFGSGTVFELAKTPQSVALAVTGGDR